MIDEQLVYRATPEPEPHDPDPDILMSEFSHRLTHPDSKTEGEGQGSTESSSVMHELNETVHELNIRDTLLTVAKVLIEPQLSKAEDENTLEPRYSITSFNRYAQPVLASGFSLKWPELKPKNYSPFGPQDFIDLEVFCFSTAPELQFIRISMSNQPVHHPDLVFLVDEAERPLLEQIEASLLQVVRQMKLHS